ncbi:transporter substrate-binding domain-containing protein [Chitinimonas arctica]|uniref:Transporter substrate-binding domain-containing protein n=1 Tax=Chitinimonas arctica TaxID=2594795 RepID=A0A516SD20_9NEIS|nr:transporter substrate-binding domain-containing protein [Chitinimonas arctica]QDQ26047.1 transporter substrate-binding domain-containing protein [Chitinimonas arctica]
MSAQRLSKKSFQFLPGLFLLGGICFAGAVAAPVPPCKQLIASGNPEYPPFLWRDPADETRLIGANAELMQRLAEEIGTPIVVKFAGPWGRVQEEVRQGRVDLIAGAFFTLPRLEYMDYFQPPIRDTRTVIWTRADKHIEYRKWSDLVPLHGITVINNSFGDAFDGYAKKHLDIYKVASVESALKMLAVGRGEYMIYEEAPGLAYAAKLNIQGLKAASTAISNEDLLLTMSHRSVCNTGEMRGRIAKAMHKLAREKLMDALIAKYIQLWRKQAQ